MPDTNWMAELMTGLEELRERPLGTAAWHRFPANACPRFSDGDFWLMRDDQDRPIGIRDGRHIFVNGGARGGKGASVIIPNLSVWQGSAVVIDPKGENAIVTARRRGDGSAYCTGLGQKILILDPFHTVHRDGDQFGDLKAAFNPLDMLHPDIPESIDDAARIADAMIIKASSGDPFWEDAARTLIKAVILHVVSAQDYEPHQRNLITLRRLLLAGEADMRRMLENDAADHIPSGFELLFEGMRRNPAFGGIVASSGEQLANLSDQSPKTLASLMQVASTNTEFLDSPAMQEVLTRSDFDLSELKLNPNGVTLYLSLPQRFMTTHHRWLRMMTSMVITEMERIKQQPACGHAVLMVLDEFAGLDRMPTIENAAAQIAGFGVKMMFVTQTLVQLKSVYKDNWETFLANSGVRLFFGNDDHFTRDYVSKLIGEHEVIRTAKNNSRSNGYTYGTGSSFSEGFSTSKGYGENSSSTWGPGMQGSSQRGHSTSSTTTRTMTTTTSRNDSTTRTTSQGETENIHKRPLLTPDEIGRAFGTRENPRAVALLSGEQPLLLKRCAYYSDPVFAGKFDPHPDHKKPKTLYVQQVERNEALARETQKLINDISAADRRAKRLEWEKWNKERINKIKHRIKVAILTTAAWGSGFGVLLLGSAIGFLQTAPKHLNPVQALLQLPVTDLRAMWGHLVTGMPALIWIGSVVMLFIGIGQTWKHRATLKSRIEKRVFDQ
ncbi:type IV secretory system conjugative DNA transfer family protein [Cohaesibacter celericrescens]|nr:type IV secretory system conjugative DNA transfer family protein [Cohaesibacter celericrescens]